MPKHRWLLLFQMIPGSQNTHAGWQVYGNMAFCNEAGYHRASKLCWAYMFRHPNHSLGVFKWDQHGSLPFILLEIHAWIASLYPQRLLRGLRWTSTQARQHRMWLNSQAQAHSVFYMHIFTPQIVVGVRAKPNPIVPHQGWDLNQSCGNILSSLGWRSDPLSPHRCPSHICSNCSFSPQRFLLSHVCLFACLTTQPRA